MAELGIFSAAYTWGSVVQFLPNQIAGAALPVLSNVMAAGDRGTLRRALVATAIAVFGVATCVAVVLATQSDRIMALYGPSFRSGSTVLTMIVLAYALGAVASMLRASTLSAGRAWLQSALALAWGVALPASFFVLRGYGADGLAVSYGVAFALVTVLQFGTARYLYLAPQTSAPVRASADESTAAEP
jgi:O-antigen/teichoic acid export membrane protein